MKHYLLSIYQPDGDPPPKEVLEPIMRDIHTVEQQLLRRLGRNAEAALVYEAAIARSANAIERDFLERSRQALTPD